MISKNHQEASVATLYTIEIKINLMRTNIKRDNEQKQCMLSLEQLHPNNTHHILLMSKDITA